MQCLHFLCFFFLRIRRPPESTLFPYTPPSRSRQVAERPVPQDAVPSVVDEQARLVPPLGRALRDQLGRQVVVELDRKSTRLNSSHANISYAVFCLKKKKHYVRHSNSA